MYDRIGLSYESRNEGMNNSIKGRKQRSWVQEGFKDICLSKHELLDYNGIVGDLKLKGMMMGFNTHISSFLHTTCDALSYHLSCIGVEGSKFASIVETYHVTTNNFR
jgi:hypothetical protein